MIALLSCSTSWCKNKVFEPDSLPSTGVLEKQDTSILIPIEYIRIANSKMIELKYEKQINSELNKLVDNDSVIISQLQKDLIYCTESNKEKLKKVKKQRNIFLCSTIGVALLSLLLLIR